MTNGEMFYRVFGFKPIFSISCDDIDCVDCPYCYESANCLDFSDRERGIAWSEMEMRWIKK